MPDDLLAVVRGVPEPGARRGFQGNYYGIINYVYVTLQLVMAIIYSSA